MPLHPRLTRVRLLFFWATIFIIFSQAPAEAQNPDSLKTATPTDPNAAHATITPTCIVPSGLATLWRGFTHAWTYNHRLNRLGNYVLNNNTSPDSSCTLETKIVHCSATGTGSDVGKFTTYYSHIASDAGYTSSGQQELLFSGREGDFHTTQLPVLIPAPYATQPNDRHLAVLNGFDLEAKGKADKLAVLHLAVNNAEYLPATKEIRFYINVSLMVKCQSVECNRINNKFDYLLRIHYLVFSGCGENFTFSKQYHQFDYNWHKGEDLIWKDAQQTLYGVGNGIYPEAALAFTSLQITLNKPHWLLAWRSFIQPENYNPVNGSYQYSLGLLFKQWQTGMKRNSANPRQSRYAIKRGGWASFGAEIALLQFSNGAVVHGHTDGACIWKGGNKKANLPDAVSVQSIQTNIAKFYNNNGLNNGLENGSATQQKYNTEAIEKYQQYLNDLQKRREQRKKSKKNNPHP